MFLSVVIPAYNEEKRLPQTLKKVADYLKKQDYEWEVIVVNDGSSDNTAAAVNDFMAQTSSKDSFRLIDNQENQGKGGVVKQGMLAAKGDWRLFMDADNSTDISELPKLLNFARPYHIKDTGSRFPSEESLPTPASLKAASSLDHAARPARVTLSGNGSLHQNYEVIIGSRYLDKGSIKIKQPLTRRMMSRLGNILIRIMLGIKSVDTQCGFKLFSAKASEEIFPKQTITRWGFDMEILAIAIRKGYQIKEVAVDWYDAEGSTVKKGAAMKTLKELWQIKRNMWAKKY